MSSLPVRLERTSLRSLRASDAESLHWIMHPEVRRHMPDAPQTPERVARYAAWAERQSGIARQLSLAVTIADQPVGIIQGCVVDSARATVEWGFALAHPHWGDGLIQESGRAFLRYAVDELGIDRVEARTAVDNWRATAALLRLGAECEGVVRAGLADHRTDCLLLSLNAADVRRSNPPPLSLRLGFAPNLGRIPARVDHRGAQWESLVGSYSA